MPNDGTPVKMDLGRILPDQYARAPDQEKTDAKGSESSGSGWEDVKDFGPKSLTHSGVPFTLKR